MTEIVLCPLNSYPSAERALPSAFDAAQLLGSRLELFSAVEDGHMVGRRRAYLEQLGAQRRGSGDEKPDVQVVVDPHAPEAIADRSMSRHVFTVMATSTQPFLHTGYFGSAAERTARESYNPVMLVGPHNVTRLGDAGAVVAACDGSPLSEQVVPHARAWANRLDVELWLVTSLSPREMNQPGYSASTESNYLRRLADQFDAEWEVLHGPDPAKSIVEWSSNSLIAVTTHGRSGISRLALGSVTTSITRSATGPVLVANATKP